MIEKNFYLGQLKTEKILISLTRAISDVSTITSQLFLEMKQNQNFIINKLNYEYNSDSDIEQYNRELAYILASLEHHLDLVNAFDKYLSNPIERKEEADPVSTTIKCGSGSAVKVIPFPVSSRLDQLPRTGDSGQ